MGVVHVCCWSIESGLSKRSDGHNLPSLSFLLICSYELVDRSIGLDCFLLSKTEHLRYFDIVSRVWGTDLRDRSSWRAYFVPIVLPLRESYDPLCYPLDHRKLDHL